MNHGVPLLDLVLLDEIHMDFIVPYMYRRILEIFVKRGMIIVLHSTMSQADKDFLLFRKTFKVLERCICATNRSLQIWSV